MDVELLRKGLSVAGLDDVEVEDIQYIDVTESNPDDNTVLYDIKVSVKKK
jgi:hypothetical protein